MVVTSLCGSQLLQVSVVVMIDQRLCMAISAQAIQDTLMAQNPLQPGEMQLGKFAEGGGCQEAVRTRLQAAHEPSRKEGREMYRSVEAK